MTTPPPGNRALAGLGARLRALRESAGLSGIEIAESLGVGWRQPKVSKIETGRQLPTPEEVEAWARVTNADPEPLLALRNKAAVEFGFYKDRVASAGGPVARQDEITALVSSCTLLGDFSPTMIPGLLQTPAYIRCLAPGGISEHEIRSVIAAKLRRQAILYEPGREIVHVVGEAALRTRIGAMTTATLVAQVLHLAEMSSLPGHTFGVLPFTQHVPFAPLSGWSMYDRDLVTIEAIDGSLQITEPEALARYSHWMDQLLEVSLTGAAAAALCRQIAAEIE